MATAGTTTSADAERRAELLLSRYDALTASNPGFHYHLHMRAWEHGTADEDSVTSALLEGRDRWVDLVRLLSTDDTFHVWRLRLEHPQWWIGGRVRGTTPLLAQVISELDNDHQFGYGPHATIGGVGSHWSHHTKEAVKLLSARVGRDLQRCFAGSYWDGSCACLHFGWARSARSTSPWSSQNQSSVRPLMAPS